MTNSPLDKTAREIIPIPNCVWDKTIFEAVCPSRRGAVVQSMYVASNASGFTKARQRDISLTVDTFCEDLKPRTPTAIG